MRFEEAKVYILDKLTKELPPYLYYHGIHHTIDVYNSAINLANLENIKGDDLLLIQTAALFHDSGYLVQYKTNENLSVKLVMEVLPDFEYSDEEIGKVCQMITATQIPQCPQNKLDMILCDADLDYLGRDDFFITAHKLHREWSEFGSKKITLKGWYAQQIKFIESHKYYTESAIKLREEKKQIHLLQIHELTSGFDNSHHLSELFDNLPVGVYRSTPSGQVLFANKCFLDIFEYQSFDELVTKTINGDEPNIGYSRKEYRNKLIKKGEINNHESSWVKKNGTILYIRENAKVVKDDNGNVIYFDGIVTDITKEYINNKEISKLNKRLSIINEGYSRFIPKDVSNIFHKKDISEIKIGDCTSRNLNILYSDFRPLTNIIQSFSPSVNFKFLNAYVGTMIPLISNFNGFVDKFVENSMTAIFENSASDALMSAIEIQKKIFRLNNYLNYKGCCTVKIGFSIHNGQTMIGAIGNEKRMEIVIIPENITIASQIEELTKTYESLIIVSENVIESLDDKSKFNYRSLGILELKNRDTYINVYEILLPEINAIDQLKIESKSNFNKAIELYTNKEYKKALKIFKEVLKSNPNDMAAAKHVEYCQEKQ